jgi:predicted membrane-bound spermidine synthase
MKTTEPVHNVERDKISWWQHVLEHSGSESDRRNQYRFLRWAAAWAVSFVGASWLLRAADVGLDGWTVWAVAVAPNLLAVAAGAAYVRFLREADELIRRIQLEALAIGFATALFVGLGYALLEHAGAPELGVGNLTVVMMVAFALGGLVGLKRYR